MLEPLIEYRFDSSELEELARQFPDASIEASEAKITEALMLLERVIKEKTPYGAGPIHLRDTIAGKVSASGEKVTGILGTPAEYGEPVELGTKPHFPPVGPIQHWVETKLGYSGREARSVAFLIARKISKKGTKGAKMFTTGWEENKDLVIRILEEIPEEIVRRLKQ